MNECQKPTNNATQMGHLVQSLAFIAATRTTAAATATAATTTPAATTTTTEIALHASLLQLSQYLCAAN